MKKLVEQTKRTIVQFLDCFLLWEKDYKDLGCVCFQRACWIAVEERKNIKRQSANKYFGDSCEVFQSASFEIILEVLQFLAAAAAVRLYTVEAPWASHLL